ncbi:hypothetical protein FACS189467_4130 [Bacteroidia bacterium]|nr:hypothetical protein FACS189467_4130 [Bacteroidia bacterium]
MTMIKKQEIIINFCNDLGKFLIDAAKVVFTLSIVTPLFKNGLPFNNSQFHLNVSFVSLIIGIVATLLLMSMGSILKNLK